MAIVETKLGKVFDICMSTSLAIALIGVALGVVFCISLGCYSLYKVTVRGPAVIQCPERVVEIRKVIEKAPEIEVKKIEKVVEAKKNAKR